MYLSIWLGALIAAAVPLPPLSAQSQSGAAAGQKSPQPRKSIEERLSSMKADLSLSDDQVAKLKAVFEDQKAKLDPIWQDASLSKEQKQEKVKPVVMETRAKIDGVLTPEQKTKLEQTRKEKKEKHAEKK